MAERVFSPKDADPAPITVIFVGSVISKVLRSRRAGWRLRRSFQISWFKLFDLTIKTTIKKDAERLLAPCLQELLSLFTSATSRAKQILSPGPSTRLCRS